MRSIGPAIILAVAVLAPAPAEADPPPEKLGPILAEMAERGAQFRADKLHAMGVEGLSAVLDWFLPGTAEPKAAPLPDAHVGELIAQLGDESSRVREAATRKLYQLGVAAQAALVDATRSGDAEISWRAVRILRAWETERNQGVNRYVTGLNVYLQGISDGPRLQELARRSKLVLDAGLPSAGGRQQVVRLCIAALVRAGKDEHIEPLRPFVRHGNFQVATFVLQSFSVGYSANVPCSVLLLDALESKEQQVVSLALNYVMTAPEAPHADKLKDRLGAIFKGNDENLKLQACRPLVGLFGDAEALDYLQGLLKGPKQDLARKYQAINALSDSRRLGKPPHPKVLEMLVSLAKSNETNLRAQAVNALANYGGEEVAKALIPLLGESLSSVSSAARRGLLNQPDRKMVRELLVAAEKNGENEKIKQQAGALVKQLDALPAPSAGSRSSRVLRRPPLILQDEDDPFGN